MMHLSIFPILIREQRQKVFLFIFKLLLIAVHIMMFIFEIDEVSAIAVFFVLFNLLFEVHLGLVK